MPTKPSRRADPIPAVTAGGPSRGRIVTLLRRHGALDASQLGHRLGMTTVGARLHVNRLREEGMIAARPERGGRGCPRLCSSLTAKAERLFPQRSKELVTSLLGILSKRRGPAGIDALLRDRQKALAASYAPRVVGGLSRRVASLVAIQRENGYMPEARETAAGLVVREWNCPIAAASACTRAFCESERRLFASLLGVDVRLEGCRADGAECCTFRVGAARGARRTQETA